MKSVFPTLVSLACTLLLVIISGLPLFAVIWALSNTVGWWHMAAVFVAPLIYAVIFVTTAGVLSTPFQKSIVPGKFPRDIRHPVYRGRRFYGTCWTAVYYFKPIYYLCLTLPWLKWLTFRLFGYRGQMDFTVYPDTWIRDLPLLDLGKGVYVANRAALGTNMPIKNNKIVVDVIRIGEYSLIGHLTVLAAGVEVGAGSEIASKCTLGHQVKIGDGVYIGPCCGCNSFSKVGNEAVVGAGAQIGFRTKIPPKAKVPERAFILGEEAKDLPQNAFSSE